MHRLFVVAVLLCSSGCTINREYSTETLTQEQLDAVAVAKTKVEVLKTVGPPLDMGIQLNGSVFIYRAAQRDLDNLNLSAFQGSFDYEEEETRTERLTIFFDKKGNVIGHGFDMAKDKPEVDDKDTVEVADQNED